MIWNLKLAGWKLSCHSTILHANSTANFVTNVDNQSKWTMTMLLLSQRGRTSGRLTRKQHSMMVALTGSGQPPRAIFSNGAACFLVHKCTTARLWKQMQAGLENVPPNQDDNDKEEIDNVLLDCHIPDALFQTKIANRRKGKFKYDRDDIKWCVKETPFFKRRRTPQLAAQLEIPQSTIMHVFKQKGSIFKRHSNSLKPKLTEDNQAVRLQFVSSNWNWFKHNNNTSSASTPQVHASLRWSKCW